MHKAFSLVVFGIVAASTAPAQHARISLGAGGMLPFGDYWTQENVYHENQSAAPGWQVMGALEVAIPRAPVGLRVDGMYGKMRRHGSFVVNSSTQLNGGTANLVYHIGARIAPLRPYVLAGAGYISDGSQFNPAFACGTGLSVRAGPWTLFVEGRLITVHTSSRALNFVPVSGGLSFGP